MAKRNKLETAYFRHNSQTEQCELRFILDVTLIKWGRINEEIRAVRQSKDTVGSLLNHIKNKIINIINRKNTNQSEGSRKEDVDIDIEASLSKSEVNINTDMSCIDVINIRNRLRFTILKTSYKIVVNAPLVETLTLPKIISACSLIKPSRFKGIFIHTPLCKVIWSKSRDKINWIEVGYEFYYTTVDDDVDYYLKFACIPVSKYGVQGPPVEVTSENVVIFLPTEIPTPSESRINFTKNKLTGKQIRVVSYNILAERYTFDDQFSYCNPSFLAADYRKQLIMKEILSYNSDLICLQEVDQAIYKNYYKQQFISNKYVSIFNKKGDVIPEGLTLVYKNSRFKKLHTEHYVLANELKMNRLLQNIWELVKQNDILRDSIMKLSTSLHLTTLKMKETSDLLLVANTHLYYHWEARHLRLLQIIIALKLIEDWYKVLKATDNCKVKVIFCGDFNSVPESGVYHFMTEGHVQNCKEEMEKLAIKNVPKIFRHNFNFVSAYGTPEFTNYTEDFKGCLDYIFYEESNIQLIKVVPLPSESEMSEDVALPNRKFPSDHVALIADLKI